ncbi:MAG: hypothetical protein LBI71_00380 [Enterobacteriaceae bacterium]|nr:hypothetical protein [Enterobacteriaceae bacterium]
MSIEYILRDAALNAQNSFKGKSFNIGYCDLNILPEEKRAFYTDEGLDRRCDAFEKIRDRLLTVRQPSNRIYDYLVSHKNSFLVGNCLLLAIFALQYLKKTHKTTLCQLYYSPDTNISELTSLLTLQLIVTLRPYNHAFALICPPSYTLPKPKAGQIYLPNQFPDDSWVCDPWANIVCPANNYNNQWSIRMREWNFKGKNLYLSRSNSPQDNDYNLSPLGKYAYTIVSRSQTTINELITIYPNGDSKITTHHSSRRCNII